MTQTPNTTKATILQELSSELIIKNLCVFGGGGGGGSGQVGEKVEYTVTKGDKTLQISHYANMSVQYTAIFHGCKKK